MSNFTSPYVGVDEVGRGCLAGPVYAAAVIFKSETDINLYIDSKKTSEQERTILAESIHKNHLVSIGMASVSEIDKYNILQATFLAMARAVEALNLKKGTIFIDGRDIIPKIKHLDQRAIIKGDQKVRLISAASIVAKVARDEFMKKLSLEYKDYGFEKHKGYGTLYHREQIQKLGPSIWHRQTFGGVKEFLR